MATSLADLRREIVKRGWHQKATARVIGELLLNLAVAIVGIYIFATSNDLLVRICAMILSTAGSMGVATNTHSSSHYATSNRRWVNELLTYLRGQKRRFAEARGCAGLITRRYSFLCFR